jgi:hypothetical protein
VKLDIPVLALASHMNIERAPENATFGTSNESGTSKELYDEMDFSKPLKLP